MIRRGSPPAAHCHTKIKHFTDAASTRFIFLKLAAVGSVKDIIPDFSVDVASKGKDRGSKHAAILVEADGHHPRGNAVGSRCAETIVSGIGYSHTCGSGNARHQDTPFDICDTESDP